MRPEDFNAPKAPTARRPVSKVDYGRLRHWVDPLTGRGRVVEGFVMTLCARRRPFVRPALPATRRRGPSATVRPSSPSVGRRSWAQILSAPYTWKVASQIRWVYDLDSRSRGSRAGGGRVLAA